MSAKHPVSPEYRHRKKLATAGVAVSVGAAQLKWYLLASAENVPPAAMIDDARRYLADLSGDGVNADDNGFVILHRCGADFYFLLVSIWRGANELWEAVYYRDGGMNGFARFDPAYPGAGPRPTFCVWELGIVAFEAAAWSRLLASPRTAADFSDWRAAHFGGEV